MFYINFVYGLLCISSVCLSRVCHSTKEIEIERERERERERRERGGREREIGSPNRNKTNWFN